MNEKDRLRFEAGRRAARNINAFFMGLLMAAFAALLWIVMSVEARAQLPVVPEVQYNVPVVAVHQGEGMVSMDYVATEDPNLRLCLWKRGEDHMFCYKGMGFHFITEDAWDYGEVVKLIKVEIKKKPEDERKIDSEL